MTHGMDKQALSGLYEPARLAALRASGLLDAPREEAFDRLTRLAARLTSSPTAYLSLVDDGRQFFLSGQGLPETVAQSRETPLSQSFCKLVAASGEALIVTDARTDPRVQDNGAVDALGCIAYVGMPITTREGHTFGALCVVQGVPRTWSDEDISTLRELAAMVTTEIDLRAAATALLAAQSHMAEQNRELLYARLDADAGRYRYQQLFELAPDGYLVTDAAGMIRQANRAAGTLLGGVLHELVGRPLAAFVPAERWAELAAELPRLPVVAAAPAWTVLLTPLQGPPVIADITVAAVRQPDGSISELHWSLRDATARVMAQNALRESEEQYRLLAENVSDVIYRLRLHPRPLLEYVSPSVQALTGYPPAAFLEDAQRFSHLLHPDDRALFGGATQTEEPAVSAPARFRVQHRDGHWRWVEQRVTPLFNEEGQLSAVQATVRDVTAQQEVEEYLRAAEARYRGIFENAVEGIFETTPEGRVLSVNPALARMVGYETPKAMLTSLRTAASLYVNPDDRERMIETVRTHGSITDFEVEMRHADGSTRWTLLSARAMHDERGELTRLLGNLVDISERRRAAEELRAREARFRLLVQNAADVITVLDAEGRITDISPAFERITGFPAAQAAGQLPDRAVHPDDTARHAAYLAAVRAQPGEHPPITLRWQMANGGYRVLESVSTNLLDDPAVQGIVINSRDVTERQAALAALRESEQRYRTVIESVQEVLFQVDSAGRWSFLNPAWTSVTGFAVEETLGRPFLESVIPEERAACAERLGALLAGERTDCRHEIRFHTAARGVRWLAAQARPSIDAAGAISGIAGALTDITEQREAEARLRERTQLIETLSYIGSTIAAELDLERVITLVTTSAMQLTGAACGIFCSGWETGALVVHSASGIGEDVVAALPAELFQQALGGTGVTRIDDTDGHPHLAGRTPGIRSLLAARVLSRTGELLGGLLFADPAPNVFTDWGEQVVSGIAAQAAIAIDNAHLFAQAQQAQTAAERANHSKSEFLSRMSHELRTPLNAILGFAQLLEMEELNEEEQESVDHIQKAGQHLLGLINEILDIARIEAGRLPLSLEPTSIADVTAEAMLLVRPQAEQRRITLLSRCAELPWRVQADNQRLKQVLLNLFSNAVKYNREGGSVEVSAAPGAEGSIRINVSDTGRGLTHLQLQRLFTPFDRLGAEQHGIEGTGIGLVLSRRLVEAMGGRMGVESVAGEGSTFWLELPAAEAPAQRVAGSPPAHRIALPEQTLAARVVLYIEDNVSNLRLMERVLARRPAVQLLAAMQGSLGLELAREHRPDAILLDLHLPDMFGDEVLTRLQADPRTRGIPVIMVSADATPAQVQRLHAAGARAYVTKPLDIPAILALLDSILGEAHRVMTG